MDITAFSFQHGASLADECYLFKLTKDGDNVCLYAEEQFFGGRIADAVVDAEVLEQLGKVAGTYRIDLWDGFDENNRKVRDGSNFTLHITLADGSTISAHGNNAFPQYYSDVLSAIETLYTELMGRYGLSETDRADPIEGGITKRQDPDAPKTIVSKELTSFHAKFYCWDESGETDGGLYTFDPKKTDEGWHLEVSGTVTGSAFVDAIAAQQVQAVIEAYELTVWNGHYSVTAGLPPAYGPHSVSAAYASGEQLTFTKDGAPDEAWCFAIKDCLLAYLSPEGGNDA